MKWSVLLGAFMTVCSVHGQGGLSLCKNPTVEHRRMADDVRYASPFYVIALPNTPRSREIDNVCYTYFENEKPNPFSHFMSITYQNGSTSQFKLSKEDIEDRNGLAEARVSKDNSSSCVYHDYTLTPICNVSVFILYRCFLQGDCNEADIGATPGVDVRVVLAASTSISEQCRSETEASLKDTSNLDGGDYYILPQKLEPHCVTRYGDKQSINPQNALGSPITLAEDSLADRFGGAGDDSSFTNTKIKQTYNPSVAPLAPSTPLGSLPKRTFADVVRTHGRVHPGLKFVPPSSVFPYAHRKRTNCFDLYS